MHRVVAILAVALTAVLLNAGPACPQDNWSDEFFMTGIGGDIRTFLDRSSDLIIGGDFETAGPLLVQNIVSYCDGGWVALGQGLPDIVVDLVEWNGQIVALAGVPTSSGSPYLGHGSVWLWDGLLWRQLGDAMAAPDVCLAVYDDRLYWGRKRWTGASWNDAFLPDARVRDLFVHDGMLVVGGDFSGVDDVVTGSVAWWDGQTILPADSGIVGNAEQIVAWNGAPVVLERIGAHLVQIHRWDDSEWNPLGSAQQGGLYLCDHDGTLYLTCQWPMIEFATYTDLRFWNGSSWDAQVAPRNPREMVSHGGNLYIASYRGTGWLGAEHLADGPALGLVVRTGYEYEAVGPRGKGFSNTVDAIDVQVHEGGHEVLVGGPFRGGAGMMSRGLCGFDGTTWSSRSLPAYPGTLLNHEGTVVIPTYDTDFLHDPWPERIWGYDQGEWTVLADGFGVVQSMVFGSFYSIPVFYSASHYDLLVCTDQFEDAGMLFQANGEILDLAIYDSDLIIAGDFTQFDYYSIIPNLVRFGTEFGALDSPPDGAVHDVLVWGDRLVAAGEFAAIGSIETPGIAAWDGSQWHPFGDGLDGTVHVVATHGDLLFAAGSFSGSGGVPLGDVAVWDGSRWSSLGLGCNGPIEAMLYVADHLWIGGDFSIAGGKPAWRLTQVDLRSVTTVADDGRPEHEHTGNPIAVRLVDVFPNPSNPATTIAYELLEPGHVHLDIVDLRGRRVVGLVDEVCRAGRHEVVWQARDFRGRAVSSGVYLVRLEANGRSDTRRLSLIR